MDETLVSVTLDISSRPFLVWNVDFTRDKIGEFDTELFEEWFLAFAFNAGITLHVNLLYGKNNHHIIEACFKGLARALRQAITIDSSVPQVLPSTKGLYKSMTLCYPDEYLEGVVKEYRKVVWNNWYKFSFTWLGVPIIQFPHDILRVQELLFKLQPNVIIETGVAYGGSVVLYASILKSLGKTDCKIYCIDPKPSKDVQDIIKNHPACAGLDIELIKKSSTDDYVLNYPQEGRKFISLDAKHTYDHVARELEVFVKVMNKGDYLLVQDTAISLMRNTVRGKHKPKWKNQTCKQALEDFLNCQGDRFVAVKQEPIFSKNYNINQDENFSFHPSGLIKCIKD